MNCQLGENADAYDPSIAHGSAAASGKGKSKGPTPPPSKGKGKGKGPPPPPPLVRGKGKGKGPPQQSSKGEAKGVEKGEDTAPKPVVPPYQLVARTMDGKEFNVEVPASDLCLALKRHIGSLLEISSSRLKLVHGTEILEDNVTASKAGLSDGAEINVIILSPLHGSLNRSGLCVPLDVMEMKMELHDLLRDTGRVRQTLMANQ